MSLDLRCPRLALVALAVCGAAAVNCGGDDESNPPAPPTPPTLKITSLTAGGGPQWKPGDADGCVERGRDDKGTVVLAVALTDFILRPPNTCAVSACGQLRLRIDPSGDTETVRIDAAQTAVDVPMADLPDGPHVLRAELYFNSGKPALDANKNPVADEVSIDLKPVGGCGGATDAGADAASDGGTEGGTDAATDAASDGATDAGSDATGDTGTDALQEVGSDAASDASGD